MEKSLFHFISISWVTWCDASAHWILSYFHPVQIKSCLFTLCHRGAGSLWPCLFSVMTLDGLWQQCRFCTAEVLPSSPLKPLQFSTAALKCGHPKHDTLLKQQCPRIRNCLMLNTKSVSDMSVPQLQPQAFLPSHHSHHSHQAT